VWTGSPGLRQITLTISDEVAAQAQQLGKSVEAYVQELVETSSTETIRDSDCQDTRTNRCVPDGNGRWFRKTSAIAHRKLHA